MADELETCRVFSGDGELLADGFVREQDRDGVLIEAEHFSGGWLDEGDEVAVVIMSAVHGACTYDASVVFAAARRIQLADLRLRERVQQRTAARVSTSLPHRAHRTVEDEDGELVEETLDVVVIDVSATGMRVRCAEELPEGTQLSLMFTGGRRPLPLVLQVVRSQPVRTDHAHGCVLLDLDERSSDELFRFVMDEQRLQAAQRRS